jgi:hypothetical protein
MIGEPDAGNPHVRFDEGTQETGSYVSRLRPTLQRPQVDNALQQRVSDNHFSRVAISSERIVRLSKLWLVAIATLLASAPTATAATIAGTVTDVSGKPLENARIDHVGKMVVVAATHLSIKPSPDEIRTDAAGHFRVLTDAPAIVVRMPGYESQRLRVTGDAQVLVTLQRFRSTSQCKLSAPPAFKMKEANDIDYTATWFYIKTKDGPQGIISGKALPTRGALPATKRCGRPSNTRRLSTRVE